MAGRPIVVSIIGDNRKLAGAVDSSTSKLGKLGKVGKAAGLAVAGGLLAAGAGAIAWGVSSVKSLARIEKINAQTTAAIKSTGGAAGVSSKHIQNLTGKLENLTATEAETTQENANLLLTFTNVKNEAGKGNKIFDQTVSTFVDMQRAIPSASMTQLGKAMNDPVKGITALTKVGVSFTEQQKKQIAGMVDSGKTMQAQKIILGELNKEFGGSGEAFAKTTEGQVELAKHAFGTLGETIFAKALPPLGFLAGKVAGALNGLSGYGPQISAIADQVGGALGPAFAIVGQLVTSAGPILGAYVAYWQQLGTSLLTNVLPVVQNVGTYLVATFGPVLADVGAIVVGQVLPALQTFGTFVAGTVIPIVVGIATKVGQNLKPVLDAVAATLRADVLPAVAQGVAKFRELQPQIQQIVTVGLKVAGVLLDVGTTILGKVLPPVITFAGKLLGTLIPAIVGVIGFALDLVTGIINIGGAVIDGGKKVADFLAGVKEKIGNAIDFVKDIPDKITGAFSGAGDLLLDIGKNIIGGLISGIKSMAGELVGTITSYVIDKIPGPVRKALGIASPSKVFHVIGGQIIQGLIVGVRDGSAGLQTAIGGLGDLIRKAWEKTGHDPKKLKLAGVIDGLDDELDKLRTKARDYEKLAKKLDQARQIAAGVKAATMGANSITSVAALDVLDAEGNTVGQTQTAQNITAGLEQKLAALTAFANNVDQLRKQGLDQDAIDAIIQDQDYLTAQALISGGQAAVDTANQLQQQIEAQAARLGNVAAVNMLGTGTQAADGFIQGLENSLGKIDKAAKRIARQLVKAIKKELGINSPSRVARELTRSFTDGIVVQTHVDSRRAQLAGETTAKALVTGFGRPQVAADALLSGAAARSGQLQLTLSAETMDQLQRGRQVQGDLDAWAGVGGRVIAQ